LRSRIRDQISTFYEHESCELGCIHAEGDARALTFMVGYIAEIVHEEGFTPPAEKGSSAASDGTPGTDAKR
jgi:hypothetical protein